MTTPFDASRPDRAKDRLGWAGSGDAADIPEPMGNLALHALTLIAEQHHLQGPEGQVAEAQQAARVVELADALADRSAERAEAMVADLLDEGIGVQTLCAEHLAPAVRTLGLWWETDNVPFSDVALAAARIQAMLHEMPEPRSDRRSTSGRSALFAVVPGEDHILGVLMAADCFRRLGWDVGLLIGMDLAETRARIVDDDRPLLGLSCSSRRVLGTLQKLVGDLRHRRPDLAIVLSGGIATDREALDQLPAFDGIVTKLDGAERVLEAAIKGARSQARRA